MKSRVSSGAWGFGETWLILFHGFWCSFTLSEIYGLVTWSGFLPPTKMGVVDHAVTA
jgi:hypothetical protein